MKFLTRPALLVLGTLAIACGSDDAPHLTSGRIENDAGPNGAGGTDTGTVGGEGGAAALDAGLVPTTESSYSDESLWLCLPGAAHDVCHEDLDATIVNADGTTEVEPHVFATNPPVDCFYVYPTASADETPNSDFVPGDGEMTFTKQQGARLSSVCNVYAPMYRQVTLSVLFGKIPTTEADREIAYGDVLNAWKYFQTHYSGGRPFVLMGHSQGTKVLKRLIQEQIDGDPAMRARLVSAFLIGGNVVVPDGKDVGGDFQNVPLCRDESQHGCVVAYSTFRTTAPPPADSLFGKSSTGAGSIACNNPAALAGGPAIQKPYFLSDGAEFDLGSIRVTTPFVTLPGFLRGECVVKNGFSYLELTVLGDPADPRADDIGGDIAPSWGLHLVDVNVTMGDIVHLAATQVRALQGG